MSVLSSGVRVGAAAFAVGLSLAGPQAVGVAAADSSDASSVSAGVDPGADAARAARSAEVRAARGARSAAGVPAQTRAVDSVLGAVRGSVSVKPAAAVADRRRSRAASVVEPGSAVSSMPDAAVGVSGVPVALSSAAAVTMTKNVSGLSKAGLELIGRNWGVAERGDQKLVNPKLGSLLLKTILAPLFASDPTKLDSANVGAITVPAQISSSPVLGFLTKVLTAFELNSPTAPANPLGALVWGWFRRVETSLGDVPVAGTPVVGTADPVTGVVTGSVNVSVDSGLPLAYTVTGLPTDGTVTVAADGSFTYTPTSFGPDTFTLTASDGLAATNQTVTVAVPSSTGLPGVVATIGVGSGPGGVAIAPNGTSAYVASYGDNKVSVIDTATNTVTATIGVDKPVRLAASPDGARVYVTANKTANDLGQISVIDTATNRVTATINLGGTPGDIAVSPDGTRAYVITRSNQSSEDTWVSVINTDPNSANNDTVISRIKVGTPVGIAVSPGGSEVYVTNGRVNTVSVIDTATNKITAVIGVGGDPYGVAAGSRKIYVGNSYQFKNFEPPSVSVINTVTDTVVATIKVAQSGGHARSPLDKGNSWVAIAPGSGGEIWVINKFANSVAVIDCGEYNSPGLSPSNTVTNTIGVGKSPAGLAISPDGRYAYVTNSGDGTVSVISTGAQRL